MKRVACVLMVAMAVFAGGKRAGDPIQRASAAEAAKTNPYAGRRDAWLAGQKLFEANCAACHRQHGEGRGKALPLNTPEVRTAPAGSVFRVLKNGSLVRGMPSFAALPEPERWQIVTYVQGMAEGRR